MIVGISGPLTNFMNFSLCASDREGRGRWVRVGRDTAQYPSLFYFLRIFHQKVQMWGWSAKHKGLTFKDSLHSIGFAQRFLTG